MKIIITANISVAMIYLFLNFINIAFQFMILFFCKNSLSHSPSPSYYTGVRTLQRTMEVSHGRYTNHRLIFRTL